MDPGGRVLLNLDRPVFHMGLQVEPKQNTFSWSSEPAYPLYGAYTVVETKTHLVVNSNVADKGIFLHGPINSSSHTLP